RAGQRGDETARRNRDAADTRLAVARALREGPGGHRQGWRSGRGDRDEDRSDRVARRAALITANGEASAAAWAGADRGARRPALSRTRARCGRALSAREGRRGSC